METFRLTSVRRAHRQADIDAAIVRARSAIDPSRAGEDQRRRATEKFQENSAPTRAEYRQRRAEPEEFTGDQEETRANEDQSIAG